MRANDIIHENKHYAYRDGFMAGKSNGPRKGASYGPDSSRYDAGYRAGQDAREKQDSYRPSQPEVDQELAKMSQAELEKLYVELDDEFGDLVNTLRYPRGTSQEVLDTLKAKAKENQRKRHNIKNELERKKQA